MRRAFTLIELLVVIAIIAILAAILFPVFAQAKEAAKKTADLSNTKQFNLGIQQYLADNDDTFPQAYGNEAATGIWRWNYNHYVPWDWPLGPGSDGGYAIRWAISPQSFANITQPYIKNLDMYASPGIPAVSGGAVSTAQPNPAKKRANMSYTYNGLLQFYGASGVATPAACPLTWTGRGKANVIGAALANPALYCNQANLPCNYVPSASGCSSSVNGQRSAMFVLSGSVWVYGKGQNWGFADGHARYRNLGMQISNPPSANNPATDWNRDPYTGYDANGFPYYYWWDGCHAWLFRPNWENPNSG